MFSFFITSLSIPSYQGVDEAYYGHYDSDSIQFYSMMSKRCKIPSWSGIIFYRPTTFTPSLIFFFFLGYILDIDGGTSPTLSKS